jgi:hypothetical protein
MRKTIKGLLSLQEENISGGVADKRDACRRVMSMKRGSIYLCDGLAVNE